MTSGEKAKYRRRVGTVRPSHLMYTAGVGALVDLPNFSVLIGGLDDWRYDGLPQGPDLVPESRVMKKAGERLGAPIEQLRKAPWLEGFDSNPSGPAGRIGVPTVPFPQWLRCTACNELAPLDSQVWDFQNELARKPDEAKFVHLSCPRKRLGRRPLAVMARFVLACTLGHLDDFPYVPYVHGGGMCQNASHPRLRMLDFGGNLGANVKIHCLSCKSERNIRQAMGKAGQSNLPTCRGRHPHLNRFDTRACHGELRTIVVGASNQWFAETMSALALPSGVGPSALESTVEQLWEYLSDVEDPRFLDMLLKQPTMHHLLAWPKEEVFEAIQRRLLPPEDSADPPAVEKDLRTAEWEVLTAPTLPEPTDDFTLRRDPDGVPPALQAIFTDTSQVERLREVRVLIGFTRLDAPDPEDPDLVVRAPLSKGRPTWLPASEVRGEGVFLRVAEPLIAAWEPTAEASPELEEHQEAYRRYRTNRYSDRLPGDFNPLRGWPGARYFALHTLSHLLIRSIALDCGYNTASLSERIYAEPGRAGILIYTAVPDAEGTLGGLVSLAEPERIVPLVEHALSTALRCSSDPLCAERLPRFPADFLHGAACHACLFVSETTCERGNRFLDRRFVVPIGDPKLAMLGGHQIGTSINH